MNMMHSDAPNIRQALCILCGCKFESCYVLKYADGFRLWAKTCHRCAGKLKVHGFYIRNKGDPVLCKPCSHCNQQEGTDVYEIYKEDDDKTIHLCKGCLCDLV